MNKHNLPWLREWEQMDLDIEKDNESVLMWFLYLLVFVALGITIAVIFVEGLDRQARIDEAEAAGKQSGRLELLMEVKREVEKEGKTWSAYYRGASQPGLSGFDGLMLVENKP